jgi:hypothetical protein
MANPGSKHYWDHDVFGYITTMTDLSKNQGHLQLYSKDIEDWRYSFFLKKRTNNT